MLARRFDKSEFSQKRPTSKRGFTLIEVMLAMAVFAIAGVALLGAAQSNFDNLSRLEQKTVANWVAANQLTAASLDTQTWPPRNNRKGQVEMAGATWYWQQKVVRTQDANLRQVTIEVRQQASDEQPLSELTTFLARTAK
ncbi:type II secretion system minor pseudopilin GspI [Thalassotalea euphylliae]|uniref:Type II secretion system protein I n=1 Tax=Thalassotalea euphylliae TaxID=1655234 RepID=A0A3E0U5Z2_9GAMM|nr:type II secretion system minor pseudopilin GspI [Thalassotalea euphylliae]REL31585.1 type II secretion system protein GspI [Thalassotalea euphylliae]